MTYFDFHLPQLPPRVAARRAVLSLSSEVVSRQVLLHERSTAGPNRVTGSPAASGVQMIGEVGEDEPVLTEDLRRGDRSRL
jgi:hypothetical protein